MKKHIVMNLRPPACDQPRNSNRDRVAHRTDNSVVTLLGLPPGSSHGWGFNPTTTQSADYPCGKGSIAQTSIYLWYPHGYSAEGKHRAQADSRHEPLKRFVPCYRDNRAELSTTWTVPINYPGSGNPLRISYVR